MSQTLRRRAEELFQLSVDLPAEQRESFILGRCGKDGALLEEVTSLLRHTERRTVASLGEVDRDGEADWVGQRIGRYDILELIGEGGFGRVYMAESGESVRRRVALKVIKPGMDTREVLARFDAERRALSLMDHPGIARVLDAGTMQSGRPYFAMELVRGLTITDYCDAYRVPVRDRLRLLVQVCRAVQHAHQKGVIHRDLKPSNVLVTFEDGVPVPKVIDFGIAKALGGRLDGGSLFTAFRQSLGTPEYMSPEQTGMSSQDVDTRTDVYALGVLLYVLLTGRTPFHRVTQGSPAYEGIHRVTRDCEPLTPSARVSRLGPDLGEIAAARGVAPAALSRLMRGELDWIVMKAIQKDRNRRYDTAAALAADVEHYLQDEPVLAGPPNVFYRVTKFVRRHRIGVSVTAVVMVALVAGFLVALVGLLDANRARTELERERGVTLAALDRESGERRRAEANALRAQQEADKALRLATFLHETLSSVNPWVVKDSDLKARTLLDLGAARLESGALSGQPEVEARVRRTLGMTYASLGDWALAKKQQERAARLFARTLGDEADETLEAASTLATSLRELGEIERAESLFASTARTLRRVHGAEHPRTLVVRRALSEFDWFRGAFFRAEKEQRAILELQIRRLGEEHAATQATMGALATTLRRQNRLEEAEYLLRRLFAINRRKFGLDRPPTTRNLVSLAAVLAAQGRHGESEAMLRRVLQLRTRRFGEDHPETDSARFYLAESLRQQKRFEEAEPLVRESLELRLRRWGSDHQMTGKALASLQLLLADAGRHEEASKVLVELIGWYDRQVARDDASAGMLTALARCLLGCNPASHRNPPRALALARRAAAMTRRSNGKVLELLAVAWRQNGNWPRALRTLAEAVRIDSRGRTCSLTPLEQRLIRWWHADWPGLGVGAMHATITILIARHSDPAPAAGSAR